MTRRSSLEKLVAAAVIIAMPLAFTPVFAAPATASLSGRIVSTVTHAPLSGAKVLVGDPKTNQILSSAATSDDGAFKVEGLPAASYRVAVEANGGLFVVETPVRLGAGESRSLQLRVNPEKAPAPGEAKAPKARSSTSFWNNPLTASLVVVGSAVVAGVIIDQSIKEEKTAASPSSPR